MHLPRTVARSLALPSATAARTLARTAGRSGVPLDGERARSVGRLRASVGPAAAVMALRFEARVRPADTFGAKVRLRMAFDRRPVLSTLCDRVAARDLIASRVGQDHLPGLLALVDDPVGLDRSSLPREHVIKVTHGSGGSVLLADDLPRGGWIPDASTLRTWPRLRLHPDDADPERIDAVLRRLLGWDFWWRPAKPLVPQWGYRDIPRRILVEELLRDADGGLPDDLKVFVVDGEPVLVVAERVLPDGSRATPAYTPDWERPWDIAPAFVAPRPRNLPTLLDIARRLGRDLDLVRVDCYDLGNRVVVGELTAYPMGGAELGRPGHPANEICAGWNPYRALGGDTRLA